MNKTALAKAFGAVARQYILDHRHRARYAELLTPRETAAHLAKTYSTRRHDGWAVRMELSPEDLDLMESAGPSHELKLDIVHFTPGLPVALLWTRVQDVEFRVGVPLWLDGAPDWLSGIAEHGSLLLLMEAADGNRVVEMRSGEELLLDLVALHAAAALVRTPDAGEGEFEMLRAGFKLLQDIPCRGLDSWPLPKVVRAAMAGRGKTAWAMASCFMASGTSMHSANGGEKGAPVRGAPVGASPRS